jgi:hypothetical protein
MNVTNDFRDSVMDALLIRKGNHLGTEKSFATQWQIPHSVWSTLKTIRAERKEGKDTSYFGKLKDQDWIRLGRAMEVLTNRRKWNVVKTDVFLTIEEDIIFCKEHSKARIFVDDCAIGKTFTAKYLSRKLPNVYYVDCSQCKTKSEFLRLIAMRIGVDHKGRLIEITETIKYWLNGMDKPLVILDEAGDLNQAAFLAIKELWNATEGTCGWYMMGADGLRAKIDRGYNNKKLGYAEIFSRFSEKYSSVVPNGKDDKRAFYRKLITDVLYANMNENERRELDQIVKRCLVNDNRGRLGGLRRAESLLILNARPNTDLFSAPART